MSTIKRGPLPTDHFTIISNAWTRDERLTWEARGLLAWLAGHVAGHDVTEAVMVAAGPAGVRAVRTMVKDLMEAGYLRRDRTPILTGGSTVDYVLTDPGECRNSTLPKVPQQHLRADQGEQAENREDHQVGPKVPQQHPRSSPEDQKKNKTPSVSAAAKRGTRIPDDFEPTEAMKTWFIGKGYSKLFRGAAEHEKFVDFWRAKPGDGGVKLDWVATWRNWMREAAERAERRGAMPISAPPGTSLMPSSGAPSYSTTSTTNKRVLEGLALAEKFRIQEENQS